MYGILLTRSSWIPFPMCSLAFSLASVRCTLLSAPRQNLDVIALNYSRSFGLLHIKSGLIFLCLKCVGKEGKRWGRKGAGKRWTERRGSNEMDGRGKRNGGKREEEETLKTKERRWEKGEMRRKEVRRGEMRRKEVRRGEMRRKEIRGENKRGTRKDEEEGGKGREEEEKRGNGEGRK
jgi:hypothetical protein